MSGDNIVLVKADEPIVCPVCEQVIVDGMGRLTAQPSCKHVEFIYCNGEVFEYITPTLKASLDLAETQADEKGDSMDVYEFLRQYISQDGTILDLDIPRFTVWVGIRRGRDQGRD